MGLAQYRFSNSEAAMITAACAGLWACGVGLSCAAHLVPVIANCEEVPTSAGDPPSRYGETHPPFTSGPGASIACNEGG